MEFYVLSTFRSDANVKEEEEEEEEGWKPFGLQWGMEGMSHLRFVPADPSWKPRRRKEEGEGEEGEEEEIAWSRDEELCNGVVCAYNRWAYAKDEAFKRVEEIAAIEVEDSIGVRRGRLGSLVPLCFRVEWKLQEKEGREVVGRGSWEEMARLLREDKHAAADGEVWEVWVNGVRQRCEEVAGIEAAMEERSGPGSRWRYERCGGRIRIEKYFEGMLKSFQVLEHLLDNLIALEDVVRLAPPPTPPKSAKSAMAWIGTATLPDWVLGGDLTSRLHILQINNHHNHHSPPNLHYIFRRPLYNDKLDTSDRYYAVNPRHHLYQKKLKFIQQEMHRLDYLSTFYFRPKTNTSTTDTSTRPQNRPGMDNHNTDNNDNTDSSIIFHFEPHPFPALSQNNALSDDSNSISSSSFSTPAHLALLQSIPEQQQI